jgi:hypothetical protein
VANAVTVIGLGCELDRLFSGQPPAVPIPGPPGREDMRDLFDAIGAPVRNGASEIVIVGDWLPPETLERVRMIRSLLQTDRIAIHVTDLPPLAASVLAALTAALAPLAPSAGALAGAIDAVADELVVLAWAGGVAGLRHSGVSLLHHARSALPWSAFAVGLQPESFVQPISAGAEELPLAAPGQPIELLVAPEEDADLDWIVDVVAPALGGVGIRQIPPTLHGAQWWGTNRLVEAVGVPTRIEALAEVTLPRSVSPCAWCNEPIAAGPCPFCGDPGASRGRPGCSARTAPALVLSPQRLRRTTMETRSLEGIEQQGGEVGRAGAAATQVTPTVQAPADGGQAVEPAAESPAGWEWATPS